MWEPQGAPAQGRRGPCHQLCWLRLHILSHTALRGGHSWSREGATPTQGFSASFLSRVLGLMLGLWPDLTPKITALGRPQTTGSLVPSAPVAQAFRPGPHLRGETAHPPGPLPWAGWAWRYVIPLLHCESEPRLRKPPAVSSAARPSPTCQQPGQLLPHERDCPGRGPGAQRRTYLAREASLGPFSVSVSVSLSFSLVPPDPSPPHRDPGWGRAEVGVGVKAEGGGGSRERRQAMPGKLDQRPARGRRWWRGKEGTEE